MKVQQTLNLTPQTMKDELIGVTHLKASVEKIRANLGIMFWKMAELGFGVRLAILQFKRMGGQFLEI